MTIERCTDFNKIQNREEGICPIYWEVDVFGKCSVEEAMADRKWGKGGEIPDTAHSGKQPVRCNISAR